MRITWLGHACFKLESKGCSLIIDPYEPDSVPGYGALSATAGAVLCSHGHRDHSYTGAVTPEKCLGKPFSVKTAASFHDGEGGRLRGENLIHIISDGEITAVHLGDLGHELTPEQAKAVGRPDVLMIPVGGFYTIGPQAAINVINTLSPRVVIPMHYRLGKLGYDVLSELGDFLALCAKRPPRRYENGVVDVGPDTEPQTAVLSFIRRQPVMP